MANSSPPRRAIVSVGTGHGTQALGGGLDHGVAGRMAMDVVDVLEAVEVDDQQRALRHDAVGLARHLLAAAR